MPACTNCSSSPSRPSTPSAAYRAPRRSRAALTICRSTTGRLRSPATSALARSSPRSRPCAASTSPARSTSCTSSCSSSSRGTSAKARPPAASAAPAPPGAIPRSAAMSVIVAPGPTRAMLSGRAQHRWPSQGGSTRSARCQLRKLLRSLISAPAVVKKAAAGERWVRTCPDRTSSQRLILLRRKPLLRRSRWPRCSVWIQDHEQEKPRKGGAYAASSAGPMGLICSGTGPNQGPMALPSQPGRALPGSEAPPLGAPRTAPYANAGGS